MPPDDKADAEESVQEITKATQEEKKSAIAKASRSLNRMAKAITEATKFVQAGILLIGGIL